jgi:hypothetical protein
MVAPAARRLPTVAGDGPSCSIRAMQRIFASARRVEFDASIQVVTTL